MKLAGTYFYGNKASDYAIENGYLDYATLAKAFDAVLNNDIMQKTYDIGYWEQESGFVDNSEEIEKIEEIIEAKEAKGITTKQMAEKIKTLPEETIRRILSGKTKTPRVDTVLDLGASVGLSSHEIFEESTAYVGGESFKALQAELDTLKNERESIIAENKSLKEEVTSLSHENDILKIKLELKEEIISTHKYYIKKLN